MTSSTRFYFLLISIASLFYCCVRIPNTKEFIVEGAWRGELIIYEAKNEFITEGRREEVSRDVDYKDKRISIPFQFEIRTDSVSQEAYMEVRNSKERIRFKPILTGRNIRNGEDTFYIDLAPYAACLKGIYEVNKMKGSFIVWDKKNYSIPFEAKFGEKHRFEKIPDPTPFDVTGNWQAVFDEHSEDAFAAIGEFTQNGNDITGSFRTETGDFRYLEGNVSGDRARLSCFDGAHAFLFDMQIRKDSLLGTYYSGHKYKVGFRAGRSDNTLLALNDTLTRLNSKSPVLQIQFYNTSGQSYTLSAPEFRGKVKVIQIMGSWCPNCRDESEFLKEYVEKKKNQDLLVMGIAFERYSDRSKAFQQIVSYKKKLQLPYELYYGGNSSKDSASVVLHQLNGIKAYPTLLFLDRNNNVVKIHTGFDGPATSVYEKFKHDFNETILQLLSTK